MVITKTPFRISFFGGGTDYPVWFEKNGGAVISTTIDKYSHVTCRYLPKFFNHSSRISYSKVELVKSIDEIEHPVVRAGLSFTGIKDGIEVHNFDDLPARSGMGSSSSFTVGFLHALNFLKGEKPEKEKLALDAIHLEQNLLKENVGCQDQVAAAFGGLNKITFGGEKKINVEPLLLNQERLVDFKGHLMLFFTGRSRYASKIAGEQIKNTPKKEKELVRLLETVDEAIGILKNGDISNFGKLLDESWKIKRSLSSKISTPLIDELYERGRRAGATGGKLLGAGGGGFILFFVPPENQEEVRNKLNDLTYVPFEFENHGSKVIYFQK